MQFLFNIKCGYFVLSVSRTAEGPKSFSDLGEQHVPNIPRTGPRSRLRVRQNPLRAHNKRPGFRVNISFFCHSLFGPNLKDQLFALMWIIYNPNTQRDFIHSHSLSSPKIVFLPTAYVVRGKVMFWHVSVHPSVCPRGGGVPQPGGYPLPRGRYLLWDGVPPCPGQQMEYLIRRCRYASCVHAGGLSCFTL